MTAKLSILITALMALCCTADAQTLKPSQIVSLYSDIATGGQLFYFKDTRNATNSPESNGDWTPPSGKCFMLTDISASFDYGTNSPTNALTLPAYLSVTRLSGTNFIATCYFTIGYGKAVNTSFATPIPIRAGDRITHNLMGYREIILRGYLTPND